MKLLLVNDTEDHTNWGSIAGAIGLKRILHRNISGMEILSIPSIWTTRRYKKTPRWLGGRIYWKSNHLLDRFSNPYIFEPSVADEFSQVAQEWQAGVPQKVTSGLVDSIKASDIVVFNAEGSTYRINRSAIRCLFTLWFARECLGKPAIFLNGSVTLGPVDPFLPAMVAKTFRAIDGVAVREPCSWRHVRKCVPDIDVELIPDAVFTFQPQESRRWEEIDAGVRTRLGNKPFFCLSLSMLAGMQPGYLRHGADESSLAELIRRLKRFVPMAVILARDKEDQWIARCLAEATDSVFFGADNDFLGVLSLLSRASFLVSGRYHHLIMATIVGCPSLPMTTTSHKIEGLCELLGGLIGEPVDATDLWSCMDAMVARVNGMLNETGLPARLRSRAEQLRSEADRLGGLVAAAL